MRKLLVTACVMGMASPTALADNMIVTVDTQSDMGQLADDQPAYDGYQRLLDYEARTAMHSGKFDRAWWLFGRLLMIDPDDVRALRERGRVAHALGKFEYAERAFGRVADAHDGAPDPEVHFLRGESLLSLGRKKEALRELAIAQQQLGPAPKGVQRTLWLARIHALRGEAGKADALYRGLLVGPTRDEVARSDILIQQAEAYVLAEEWTQARKILESLLRRDPLHKRARAMLAWTLEAEGSIDQEVALRAVLAKEWGDHPAKVASYARALERAYEYPSALEQYRKAEDLGVDDVSDDVARLESLLAIEAGAGASLRNDPSGTITGYHGGVSVPLGARLRVAASGRREQTSGGIAMFQQDLSVASALGMYQTKRGDRLAVRGTAWGSGLDAANLGASASFRSRNARYLQVHLDADANTPWRESSSTIREGGTVDSVDARLYSAPLVDWVVLSVGGQIRRLGLTPIGLASDTHGYQQFGSLGIDVIPFSIPSRQARSHVFDEDMTWSSPFATALVLSYRHYELSSDNPFMGRVDLIERSSTDEVSSIVRHVLDPSGVMAVELGGGVGYDRERSVRQWRASTRLLLSATTNSRLAFDVGVASESATGLSGQRSSGSVVLHVDF